MGHKTMLHSDSLIHRRRKRPLGAFLFLRLLLAICVVFLLSREAQAQDVVLEWNAHAANAIATENQPPPRGLIRLAMVHLAIYDAVNAIEGYPFSPYAVTPSVIFPASREAATAAAAHGVLVALFPNQQADLNSKYAATLAAMPDGSPKTNGICVGQQSAAGILSFRANDGRDAVIAYSPGSAPGMWNPTPPGFLTAQAPEVAHVQPFTLNSPSQFRAEPPPDFSSEIWVRDYNETKTLGRATVSTRTPEQTDLARFMGDQPLLQWNRAWRSISASEPLSLLDKARFFAMLTSTSSDALIACWDSKFFYNFWRPVTAIRAGDTDGNPDTEPDLNWIGLVNAPNHPEYPAAHGCFSSAAAETLQFFFGTDRFDFIMDSKVAALTNPTRHYTNFSQAVEDALDARIYGGMHYRNSTRVGAIIGKQVSNFATRHFFRSSRGRANQ